MPKAATSQKSKATPRVNGNGGDSVEDRLGRVEGDINEIKTSGTQDEMQESMNGLQDAMNELQDAACKAVYKSALLTLGNFIVVATITGIIFGFFVG